MLLLLLLFAIVESLLGTSGMESNPCAAPCADTGLLHTRVFVVVVLFSIVDVVGTFTSSNKTSGIFRELSLL